MYPIPPTEHLIETKTCRHCGVSFPITDKDMGFYDKVSPVFAEKKYQIPTPTLCPDCRQQRRLSFRNERKLYRRKCDLTGKDVISIFSPDKSYKVYETSEWWSDKWDAMNYGPTNGINFEESFFSQFSKLQLQVPRLANNLLDNENTIYCNMCWHLKNCYYCFNL